MGPTLTDALLSVTGSGTSGGGGSSPVIRIIFGVVFTIIGLVNAIKPDVGWKLNRWQFKNKKAFEPSKAGLIMTRVVGVVFVVFGIVFAVSA